MKTLSIIIVNYNVEFFLKQCLLSVKQAIKDIDAEIIIVDNNSVDNSIEMIKTHFTDVILIENKKNVGFSKANNQGIEIAQGKYVLLLNPDTLVQLDTFKKCIDFMESNQEIGCLGVHMQDGKGRFLPESKRGLPTPWVAFYKIFGLSRILPNSKRFGKYHLGYLDKNKSHQIDVISGAFMFIRKSVLDKVGYLDETFFMYGEDIDLSYRIAKAGYKNYYFADTKIIHYKGESTKKGSLNYVRTFYNAMQIFAEKHYSNNKKDIFIFLIKLAIIFRATLAIFRRFTLKAFLFIIDFIVITLGFYAIAQYWQKFVIFPDGGSYPQNLIFIALPSYVLIWIFSSYLNGSYDKKTNYFKILKGVLWGTLIIILIYSLLDHSMRFSRALIFLGSIWTFLSISLIRFIKDNGFLKNSMFNNKRYIIVGDDNEPERVKNILLKSTAIKPQFVHYVSTKNDNKPKNDNYIGTFNQLDDIIRIYNINEVIFCSKNIKTSDIIDKMSELNHMSIDMKIAPVDSIFIIGSNSINASGDVFYININNIEKDYNKRCKRTFDFFVSLLFLIFYPFLLFIVNKPLNFLKNIFLVLFGNISWVGFTPTANIKRLPKIKKGILKTQNMLSQHLQNNIDDETIYNLNILYARDYNVSKDIVIIWRAFKKLGNYYS